MAAIPKQGENYIMQPGDVLSRIAVVAYGDAGKWKIIADANGIVDEKKIPIGRVIYIPPETAPEELKPASGPPQPEPPAPAIVPPAVKEPAKKINKPKGAITLILEGREVRVSAGRLGHGLDQMCRQWACDIPFIPKKDPWLDEVTARGSFAAGELYFGPELVATGKLYERTISGTDNESKKTLTFASAAADMVDSSLWPANSEIRDCNLKQIAEKIMGSAGFKFTFIDPPGAAFPMIQCKEVETVAAYFQRLAGQRGLFISTDEEGTVIFQKLHDNAPPVANIVYGESRSVTAYSVTFNDRLRFREYHAANTAADGTGIEADVTDPTVKGPRQIIFDAANCNSADIVTAAEWVMIQSNMEAFSFTLPLATWWDDNGEIFKDNTKIILSAPILDIKQPSPFIIRAVEFSFTPDSRTAALSLVPPLHIEGGRLKGSIPDADGK
ncbi:hypothetical protein AGMMS49991_04510 [Spirochaetia bacterium]|nr:hypothetical protein AGMMS49991_04510 [Spirochaetia bacterium]